MFNKAFTLYELIIIIILISILSFTIIPRINNNGLYDAANQVLFHIRYTQHLAFIDNKFDLNKPDWYKERWQIFFTNRSSEFKNSWSYIIFSDSYGHTGKPDKSEIATNPLNRTENLTGGYTSGGSGIRYENKESTQIMNIGERYRIEDVKFIHCGRSKRVSFDQFGRPYYGDLSSLDEPFKRKLTKQCKILLCLKECRVSSEDEKIAIVIEPETGYAHILE